jgi:methyltransferase (TIGR00027 family)
VEQLKSFFATSDGPLRRGLRADALWRTRHTEERLAQAVRRGIGQYVVFGAGLETFAYRQPAWARSLRIYEIDHRASQEEKRRMLQDASIAVPENLQFVAADFEEASLREALRGSALDFSMPTFFSCLGVLVYLTRPAVDAIFDFVAGFPAASEMIFTYSKPENADSALAARLSGLGEPLLTHLDPSVFVAELRTRGFSSVSLLSLEDGEQAYFRGRSDGLHPAAFEQIAEATIGKN